MTAAGALVAGRYRLASQLGGGGMGAVWLARDELLGREVAVKQVLVPAGTDAELAAANREAAMREGRIAARLSHPHAVGVYDMVLDQGQPWLVMEYLPSRSLAVLLQDRGVLPVAQVAQIGAQVADALTATHAAGIVHRDVKPGNILIGEGPGREGLVKITDFGISRATGDVSLTQTGVVKGTPAFLAPEVAQGHPPDEAGDVFSLGATLYACLEGTPPFGLSDNALQMLHRVAGGEFTPPQHAGALTAPLMRMLAPDPARRPTMPEVRDELARLAAGPDRDVTEVLTARTRLPKTLPGMPRRPRQTEVEPVVAATPLVAAADPRTSVQPAAEPTAEPAAEPTAQATGGAGAQPPAEPIASGRPPRRDPSSPRPAPAPSDRRRRWIAVLAAVLGLGLVAVVAAVLLNRNGDPSAMAQRSPLPPSASPSASSSPAPSTAPSTAPDSSSAPSSTAPSSTAPESSSSSPPATTAAGPAPESAATGPPTAAQLRDAVTSYYALVQRDPRSAYELTGPTLRAVESRGDYIAFWNRFREVKLGPVQATDGNLVVTAPVTFVEKNGSTSPEQHTITLVRSSDGRLLIDSDVPG